MMQLSDFDFNLPQALIARHPLEKRSDSRLLCLNGSKGTLLHLQFNELITLIEPGDLLVFNDTKVIPARLYGQKVTGGQVELLAERILDKQHIIAQVRASKSPRIGDVLLFKQRIEETNEIIQFEIVERRAPFYLLRYTHSRRSILDVIEAIGEIPLPPYMQRRPVEADKERYQTVYAKSKGSVAAPTAGFHFDEAFLKQLQNKQVEIGFLTLHIGAGTFTPVRVNNIHEHHMHSEFLDVSVELCTQIKATKARGKRVIAVGTTSMRALETASQHGSIETYHGETRIFIYPGYRFQCVDALITNLHLPSSTLLMLVCAFGGYDNVMNAYHQAVDKMYRFYSYGDAMWVTKKY